MRWKPMNPNFTQEDLILFIYNEMEPQRASLLNEELLNNSQLSDELKQLKETHQKLGAAMYKPNPTSVSVVMDYSASYHSAPEHYKE